MANRATRTEKAWRRWRQRKRDYETEIDNQAKRLAGNSSQRVSVLKIADTSTDEDVIFAAEILQARSLGADIIMSGTFARVSDQIGVSLSIAKMSDLGKTQEVRTGLMPISKEITELTPDPIPGLDLKDGIPRSGKAGISMPVCTHCPPAEFPRNAAGGGVVHLEVFVTTEGRTEKITIIDTPSPELAASAVRAVQGWRFKPAIGFDGKPIAVYAPIDLTFHWKDEQKNGNNSLH